MAKHANAQEYMEDVPAELREVAEKALTVIDAAMPGVDVALWQGQPTWSVGGRPGQKPVCFLKAYTKYVTFGLWKGQEVEDASGRLEAASRQMAAVKLPGVDDVDGELFAEWLRQARAQEE